MIRNTRKQAVRLTISIIMLFLLSFQHSNASEAPCVTEFRNAYKNFFSSMMHERTSQKGSYMVIEIEKKYRNSTKSERDTIYYIIYPNKRVKMYNKKFTIYSDKKNYILVMPALHKIAIQKIEHENNSDFSNPMESIMKIGDIVISDKNYQSCTEFVNSKNKKCKELILKFPSSEKNSSVRDNIHFFMDLNSRTLLGSSVYYKPITNVLLEKYLFSDVNTSYILPWDMLCPLEETVFMKDKKLRAEYEKFTFIDLRKQSEIPKLE